MISSLLHLVGLRPRVYNTLTNFREGGGQGPLAPPPPQYAIATYIVDTVIRSGCNVRCLRMTDEGEGYQD